jgi:hypothetical protein
MDMEEYRQMLYGELVEKRKKFLSDFQIASSSLREFTNGGNFEEIDLHLMQSTYRFGVELAELTRVYNLGFSDSEMEKFYDEIVRSVEQQEQGILTVISTLPHLLKALP